MVERIELLKSPWKSQIPEKCSPVRGYNSDEKSMEELKHCNTTVPSAATYGGDTR